MKSVNKHGLKMVGIRFIAGKTKRLQGYYADYYLQLFYNRSTGEAWADEHVSFGHNSWTVYHDPDIVNCGFLTSPHTMQQIADRIRAAVA